MNLKLKNGWPIFSVQERIFSMLLIKSGRPLLKWRRISSGSMAKAILFLALLLATAQAEDHSVSWSPSTSFIPWFGHRSAEFKYDRRMIHAAEIAANRADAKPTWRCWHFVKDALLEAGVISTRPVSAWAKQAGDELCSKYGFRKLPITNPKDAPVGSVLVYGGADAGHVELRTASGYVSDFISPTPYPRPLIGVYVKET